jgi:hypothetical protein
MSRARRQEFGKPARIILFSAPCSVSRRSRASMPREHMNAKSWVARHRTCNSSVGSDQLRKLGANSIERDAVAVQDRRGGTLATQQKCGEQVLGTDVAIAPPTGFHHRKLQDAQCVITESEVIRCAAVRVDIDLHLELSAQGLDIDPESLDDLHRAAFLPEQSEQDVLGAEMRSIRAASLVARNRQRDSGSIREPIKHARLPSLSDCTREGSGLTLGTRYTTR